jgi:hypothetical protein
MRALVLLVALLATAPAPAFADEHRVFRHDMPDEATWLPYSRVIGSDRLGKFLIELSSGQIYFFDVNLYRLHADFVFHQFYGRPMQNADIPEYNRNYEAKKPRFILGYLTCHMKTGIWTFSFWEGDQIRPNDIRMVRQKLLATFYKAKELRFRPDSPAQEKLLAQLKDLPSVTNDKIYKAASYQSFNNGRAVGMLRVVAPKTPVETLTFSRDEIVILQEIYPDISPVAGILSTVFQTPLAHVNLRAKAWNIPNAGFKDAGRKYAALAGKMVVLEVRDKDHVLRPATDPEVAAWHETKAQQRKVVLPPADLQTKALKPLARMTAADVRTYGTKTSNLGLIAGARLPGVHIPDGFGVPFAYYVDHMKRNKLDVELEKVLGDPRFKTDGEWRKTALEALRTKIKQAPINPATLAVIHAKVQKDLGGKGVFVRSSTNAEDLEGFNGAGLYDTVPNVKGKKALADALRQCWSSLWNSTAVEERSFYGIDHRQVYFGVLVQVGVNATAAGVLITRNLFDLEDARSFTINAKRGLGLRVVSGTTVPEQIVYDPGNQGTKIVSRSDDPTMLVFDEKGGVKEVPNPNRGVILSEPRAKALGSAVERFIPLFSQKFPLDVEWVLEGEKVWIVQARPYVSKN